MAAAWAARHANILLRQQELAAAVGVLAQHGVSADGGHFQLYTDLALEVLGAASKDRDKRAEMDLR